MDFSIFKYAYAISGGIGSGKSSACQILKQNGYDLIDADQIAHEVLEREKQEVVDVFGSEILDQEGYINRRALGKLVFGSKEKLKKLEDLLDSHIAIEIFAQCQELEAKCKIFFIELPLLFEKQEVFNFKHKILIYAPRTIQIQRILERDGLSLEEVLQRIQFQMPMEQKRDLASVVIENCGNIEKLEKAIQVWMKGISQSF